MLKAEQIRMLLELLAHEQVAKFDGYIVLRHRGGYSKEPVRAQTQAALSIMLEVAAKSEAS